MKRIVKIWIDDIRPAPPGYYWCKSVNEAKREIPIIDGLCGIEVIDIDHDAGDFTCFGGDYIRILDWLEVQNRSYPIHIHSMNPVGVENMRAIIKKNNWEEK